MVIETAKLIIFKFNFNFIFKSQICPTKITNLLQFTINFRKYHSQPRYTSQLAC
jgi:hypothetical protein